MPRPRIKKTRDTPVAKVARQIELASRHLGDFELADKVAYSSADASAALRSGEKQTLRRTTKIDQLKKRGIIDAREALACEWYHGAHEQQYAAKLKIAQWDAGSASSDKAFGHWPAKAKLGPGQTPYEWARDGIDASKLFLFERVVLTSRPLGKLSITFRQAARQLLEHIEGKVAL